MPTADETLDWQGKTMIDGSGYAIGEVQEVLLSAETEEPVWALVQTGASGGSTFVPLVEASQQGESVRVPYAQSMVATAPGTASNAEVTAEEAAQLDQHYGSAPGTPESGGGNGQTDQAGQGATGRDVSGPTTDDAMTRSEEEVQIGTTSQETGTARLTKQITSEEVTQTVPLQYESVHVASEPITEDNVGDATSGGDLTEEEHEVTLVGEEVDVQKQVVPKERVRLEKDVTTEDAQVTEEVRKEEIETEGVGDADSRPS